MSSVSSVSSVSKWIALVGFVSRLSSFVGFVISNGLFRYSINQGGHGRVWEASEATPQTFYILLLL